MHKRIRGQSNMSKVSSYAITANALQILFAAGILLYAMFAPNFMLSGAAEKALVGTMTFVVIWGAVLDIREAFGARRIMRESSMIEDALTQLEALNGTLRAQRHDFMNHLQVVYSLTEMQEYGNAQEYIERIYEDIQRVGKSLKTSVPAVNALIAAKMADCEERNIAVEMDIRSSWDGLPMHGWEMCRVLGNLIDNAVDAILADKREGIVRKIGISIGEDVHAFTFKISNSGLPIAPALRESIFQMGFTTKSAGRGMGLHIVSEIMKVYGGSIELDAGDETCFMGMLPKQTANKVLAESQTDT